MEKLYLRPYFEEMIRKNVIFYLGAHWHSYERIYPYIGGGKTQKIESPYYLNSNNQYLLSVLEGIAGNDKNIVEEYDSVKPCTANLSFNQTGYGILTIDSRHFTYKHYESKDPKTVFDEMTAYFQSKKSLQTE